MKKAGPNLPASTRAKLLNLAKAAGEEFQSVLVNYAVERLLFRLGESRHRDRLVLKGAQLFRIWLGELHRPTRDLDLLGSGSPELDDVAAVMREVASHDAADGIEFDLATLAVSRIREDAEYDVLVFLLRVWRKGCGVIAQEETDRTFDRDARGRGRRGRNRRDCNGFLPRTLSLPTRRDDPGLLPRSPFGVDPLADAVQRANGIDRAVAPFPATPELLGFVVAEVERIPGRALASRAVVAAVQIQGQSVSF